MQDNKLLHDRSFYSMSVQQVGARLAEAGYPRTATLIARYCRDGRLEAIKETGPSGNPTWFIKSASVETLIGELRSIGRQRIGVEAVNSAEHGVQNSAEQFRSVQHSTSVEISGTEKVIETEPSRGSGVSTIVQDSAEQFNTHEFEALESDLLAERDLRKKAEADLAREREERAKREADLTGERDHFRDRLDEQVKRTEEIQSENFAKLTMLMAENQRLQAFKDSQHAAGVFARLFRRKNAEPDAKKIEAGKE